MSETWVLDDGRTLVLAFHKPDEWAPVVRAQLVRLGCSEEHADRRVRLILSAKPPGASE